MQIKKYLFIGLSLIFLLIPNGHAQQTTTVIYNSKPFTATGSGSNVNLIQAAQNGTPVSFHKLNWYPKGTVASCQVKLEQSTSGADGSWTDLISNQACTSSGKATITEDDANYVRITLSTFSGSATPSVTVVYTGYPTESAAGTITADVDITGNTAGLATETTLTAIKDAVQDTAPVAVYPQATLTGGTTGCAIVSAASTNATSCKITAAAFYGYELLNTTTTVYYLRLYNTASAPTCSSATGFIRSIPIPPASTSGLVGGVIKTYFVPNTSDYGTGLGYCLTGGSSSTDNTNAAIGILGRLEYK